MGKLTGSVLGGGLGGMLKQKIGLPGGGLGGLLKQGIGGLAKQGAGQPKLPAPKTTNTLSSVIQPMSQPATTNRPSLSNVQLPQPTNQQGQNLQGAEANNQQVKNSFFKKAQEYKGMNETRDRATLKKFFKQAGGLSADPKTTAWCAAFANSVIGAEGGTGTNSLAAKSFLKWGSPVKNPSKGDVVVLHRTNDPSKGHVGFFSGYDDKGNVLVLGGNSDNQVMTKAYSAYKVAGFRRASGLPTDQENTPKPSLLSKIGKAVGNTLIPTAEAGSKRNVVSNSYLKRLAQIESRGNPNAVSPTGAKGLYQFTKSTWNGLGMKNSKRTDPKAQHKAIMKFTQNNSRYLAKRLGRPAATHELYMAHNIGAGGAMRLISANPNAIVSKKLIGSNPRHNPKFLMSNGKPVTAKEALRRYKKSFEGI